MLSKIVSLNETTHFLFFHRIYCARTCVTLAKLFCVNLSPYREKQDRLFVTEAELLHASDFMRQKDKLKKKKVVWQMHEKNDLEAAMMPV